MKKPVVVIIFNRPDKTKLLFESISKYKPDNLFIISDGPRKNVLNDCEKVKVTREIFKNISIDFLILNFIWFLLKLYSFKKIT